MYVSFYIPNNGSLGFQFLYILANICFPLFKKVAILMDMM